jgi:hypothetical protein
VEEGERGLAQEVTHWPPPEDIGVSLLASLASFAS